MIIAVDAMGGDFAPFKIVRGAFLAAACKKIPVALFGPQNIISAELDACSRSWQNYPIIIHDAAEIIEMDEEPVSAIQKKRLSSLVLSVQSVKQQLCHGVISAGNSGALMAAAAIFLGKQPGILRPAIAGLLPSIKGSVLMLDLGASTECRPEQLYQFATMGNTYARDHLQISNPRIGLLANGHEEKKGSALTKATFILLKNNPSLNFIGNVEPSHVFQGSADVVVSDGFSGNVFLKTMESTYEFLTHRIVSQIEQNNNSHHEWGNNLLEYLQKTMQTNSGAPLLGVNGSVIVCHGNANEKTIEQAIVSLYTNLTAMKQKIVSELGIFSNSQ